jgi:hypothetical protein
MSNQRILPPPALEKSIGANFTDRAAAEKALAELRAAGWPEERLRLTERSDSCTINCVLDREESALWVLALLERLGGSTDGEEPRSPRAEDQAQAPMGSLNPQHPTEPLRD